MHKTLWTRNFTLLTAATVMGAAGGIAGSFALSFLVYDETGSTLASALLIALQVIPTFLVPLVMAPFMDRLPRKPFLVGGDAVNGVLYALAGLYLLRYDFSYIGYLFFSLLLSSLSAFDTLAYTAIFPKLIPEGFEQKGFSVSSMIYPVLMVIMMPVAALLLDTIGVAWILLLQSALSFLAALTDNGIRITEENRMKGQKFSLQLWLRDIREALTYLRKEKGLLNIYAYMSVTNGAATGYSSLLIAFFRTAPGFTAAMYSFFSVAEFSGRTLGGAVHYKFAIPPKKRFSFAFFVYQLYELMDAVLLWLPYPLMLANRALCGFLGINSATLRETAVQGYIPEELRARINAFYTMICSAAAGILSLLVGALGEIMELRLAMTVSALSVSLVCWLTMWRGRRHVRQVYCGE